MHRIVNAIDIHDDIHDDMLMHDYEFVGMSDSQRQFHDVWKMLVRLHDPTMHNW